MDHIHIYDDFLSSDDLKKARDIIESKYWQYGHVSNKKTAHPFFWMDLIDDPFFAKYLLEKIKQVTCGNYIINRVYANGQNAGMNGSYHKDDEDPNTRTFCLYITHPTYEYMDEVDGHLMIRIPGRQSVMAIEPLPNRGVVFPSNMLHKGNAFHPMVKEMRVCVAWKLCVA